MTNADEELQAKIKALQNTYKANLATRLDEIDAALENLRAAGGINGEKLNTLLALAHKLTGSAGTFGLAAISDIAGDLEALCSSHIDGGTDASEELERMTTLAADLRKAAETG
ncbi:MAG: Hpt domain-containing protein [Alphaproteobacteria bacterium]|jgi:HPt (histidine-containing phosphotransfer) domain-containing protein|nr:Hpt domain-containing protein [Alphaproteobacteria bacterium]